jgi:hypothetical protein
VTGLEGRLHFVFCFLPFFSFPVPLLLSPPFILSPPPFLFFFFYLWCFLAAALQTPPHLRATPPASTPVHFFLVPGVRQLPDCYGNAPSLEVSPRCFFASSSAVSPLRGGCWRCSDTGAFAAGCSTTGVDPRGRFPRLRKPQGNQGN